MADEKKAKDGAKQEGKAENKVIAWFKALPKRIVTPFKNMVNELKRVTWPSKQKLIRYSIIVLVFVLIMMLIIGLFDFGSARLVNALHIQKPAATDKAGTEGTAESAAPQESAAPEESPEAEENSETEESPKAEEAPVTEEPTQIEEAPEAEKTSESETAPEAAVETAAQDSAADEGK